MYLSITIKQVAGHYNLHKAFLSIGLLIFFWGYVGILPLFSTTCSHLNE